MSNTFRARKRFGQNFLSDSAVIDDIITAVSPQILDHIVEIGPGRGALTRPLLPLCQQLDAIEIDRDLIAYQQAFTKRYPHFHLHEADALYFDLASLTTEINSLRIVGNLPYNITTPLLFHLFSQSHWIRDIHVMVQKEVAERLVAPVNTSHYSKLTVMSQYYCDILSLFDVPPTAFKPAPQVMSSFIQLRWKKRLPANETKLQTVVQLAFSQRRKTVQNSLKTQFSVEAIRACGIDPNARAQALSIDQFICLSKQLD